MSLSGAPIAAEDPQFQGTIFVVRNITDRKRAERRIRYLARYDALTKVPNRMQFQHMLQQAIARARRLAQRTHDGPAVPDARAHDGNALLGEPEAGLIEEAGRAL